MRYDYFRSLLCVGAILSVTILPGISGCGKDTSSSDADSSGHDVTVQPQVSEADSVLKSRTHSLIGTQAPAFSLQDLLGNTVTLKDMSGRVVLLDFWATWCVPCIQAMPEVISVVESFSEDKLAFYAVNYQEPAAVIAPFLKRNDISVPVLLDITGAVADSYAVEAFPHSVLVDQEGVIRAVHVGYDDQTAAKLRNEISELLSE